MEKMMYAIVETGGKQYKVAQGDTILVERLPLKEKEKTVHLEKVLLAHDGKQVRIGTPYLSGAKVVCQRVGEDKGPKIIDYQYKRRKGYHRKVGHRQNYLRLKVQELIFS